jgi:hypothetical protein
MFESDHFYLYNNGHLSDITEIQRFLAVSKDLRQIPLKQATTNYILAILSKSSK